MTRSPIPRALSTLFTSHAKILLMGGQACILYGAAEFSRDIDLAVLVSPENLERLRRALAKLAAERVYFPDLGEAVLRRGHACHFRCEAEGVAGLRIDVMGALRNVPAFDILWGRREEIDLPGAGRVAVMSLEDLVTAKKTQRDKDWPMIRRLLEADVERHGLEADSARVRFWLRECRTPAILTSLAETHPKLATELSKSRPLLDAAIAGEETGMARLLRDEEDEEREKDRRYWEPLRRELELWRRSAGDAS